MANKKEKKLNLKKVVNGREVDLTPEEVEAFYAPQPENERLDHLKKGLKRSRVRYLEKTNQEIIRDMEFGREFDRAVRAKRTKAYQDIKEIDNATELGELKKLGLEFNFNQ